MNLNRRLVVETLGMSVAATAIAVLGPLALRDSHEESTIPGVPPCSDVLKGDERLENAGDMDPEAAKRAGMRFCLAGEIVLFYYPPEPAKPSVYLFPGEAEV